MDISIIIPSFNTQDTIGATLKNLCEQKTQHSFETILVDCSEHDKVHQIAKQFPSVKYLHRTQRFNPGEGRNIGAQHAAGTLLMFIDSDVHLAPDALNAAWQALSEGKDIFGGALELNTRSHSDIAAYLEHYFFNHEAQALRPAGKRNNLSSALMCFRKEVFLKAGGFKDIPRMQDTELTERLRKQGYTLFFCPEIVGLQTQDSPLRKVLKKIYINGQNLYYIRYHPTINFRKKLLFYFLLPFISAAKVGRIIARHLRHQSWPNKFRTLLLSPVLIGSIFYWMAGFYHSLWTEKGISKER